MERLAGVVAGMRGQAPAFEAINSDARSREGGPAKVASDRNLPLLTRGGIVSK